MIAHRIKNWEIGIGIKFKVEDLWIGVFYQVWVYPKMVDIYICILPTLPIHVKLIRREEKGSRDGAHLV